MKTLTTSFTFKLIWRLFSPPKEKSTKMKSMEMNVIFFLFRCVMCYEHLSIHRNSFPVEAIYHWMCHRFLLKTNLKVQRIQMTALPHCMRRMVVVRLRFSLLRFLYSIKGACECSGSFFFFQFFTIFPFHLVIIINVSKPFLTIPFHGC